MSKTFEEALEKENANPPIRHQFTGKCIQNRYERPQAAFDRSRKRDQFRSGVCGEEGEIYDFLMMCLEARDAMEVMKRAERRAVKELDDKNNAMERN